MDKNALIHGLTLTSDKAIEAWAKSAESFMGIKADKALSILSAAKDKAAQGAKDTKLTNDLLKLKVPAALARMVRDNTKATIVVRVDGDKVVYALSSKRAPGKARIMGEGISSSSRIAWRQAAKKGKLDYSETDKTFTSGGLTTDKGIKGGIGNWIVRELSDTPTAKVLRDYGYTG